MVVKRNPINFPARKQRSTKSMNYMTVNHFVPIVKRNEDLYSFIVMKDCDIKRLSIFVVTMKDLENFSLNMYHHHGSDFIRKTFEIKLGLNTFDIDNTPVDAGEVVRLDIIGIDSVYGNVSGVSIGILLSDRVGI